MLEENRAIPDRAARTEANRAARERFLARRSPVSARVPRILIMGCPISGVYRKALEVVKQSGGRCASKQVKSRAAPKGSALFLYVAFCHGFPDKTPGLWYTEKEKTVIFLNATDCVLCVVLLPGRLCYAESIKGRRQQP